MKYSVIATLSMALAASARPSDAFRRRADFTLKNGQDALALNQKFATLTPDSACSTGDVACINGQFAQCNFGKFVLTECGATLTCAALPLVNSAGTSVTCTTASDRDARIAATGATTGSSGSSGSSDASSSSNNSKASSTTAKASSTSAKASAKASKASSTAASASSSSTAKASSGDNAAAGKAASSSTSSAAASSTSSAAADSSDAQTTLTLVNSNIQTGYAQDGSANATAGQEPSQTSTNNFINFCMLFPNLPHTNGQQIKTGSCNQTPMGAIAAQSKMPSAKFQNPKNMATIKANTDFNITVHIVNLELGHFTNPDSTYHMAPQVLNDQGLIKGHSHVVVEKISSINSTSLTDPTTFAFFKGINDQGTNGVLSTPVTGGLPKGTYRLSTIVASANHQPALVAVAQRGSLDDVVYFTVE